jgi:hypothetical protein
MSTNCFHDSMRRKSFERKPRIPLMPLCPGHSYSWGTIPEAISSSNAGSRTASEPHFIA